MPKVISQGRRGMSTGVTSRWCPHPPPSSVLGGQSNFPPLQPRKDTFTWSKVVYFPRLSLKRSSGYRILKGGSLPFCLALHPLGMKPPSQSPAIAHPLLLDPSCPSERKPNWEFLGRLPAPAPTPTGMDFCSKARTSVSSPSSSSYVTLRETCPLRVDFLATQSMAKKKVDPLPQQQTHMIFTLPLLPVPTPTQPPPKRLHGNLSAFQCYPYH